MFNQYQLPDKDEQELIQQAIIESNKSLVEEEEKRLIEQAIIESFRTKDQDDEFRLIQKTIEESNRFNYGEDEQKLIQQVTDNSIIKYSNVGLNQCLAETLAKIVYFINIQNGILNVNDLTPEIDDFLRNYHKSFDHYKNEDLETREEIDKNYNNGVQLPYDLFEVGMNEILPNKKIRIFTRTYIIDTESYDVIVEEIGNGEIIDGIYVLFTSSIKYDNTNHGERYGGHFETFKSNLDINVIKKKLESNENSFDILIKM